MTNDKPKTRRSTRFLIVAIAVTLVLGTAVVLTQMGSPPPGEQASNPTGVVRATTTPLLSQTADDEVLKPAAIRDGIWEGIDADFDLYVLALSWQPAFCETRPDKPECLTQTEGRFDATNFVLHGLWPDDGDTDYNDTSYCGVSQSLIRQDESGRWCEMAEVAISSEIETELFVLMPGTTSCLHTHEWVKHGTCSELTPDAYYALSNHLTELFSQTAFNAYVAERVGTELARNELLSQFEEEFGPGTDRYLSLQCEDVAGTSMLTELRITLSQDIDAEDSFGELFPDRDVRPRGSCPQLVWIDEVGIGN